MSSTFLNKEIGVAMSGTKWDIGNFKLWQGVDSDVILFMPRQPVLAQNTTNGRYQIAVSQYRQQQDDTYKVTGGSAIFTITSAVQFDAKTFEDIKKQWYSEMRGQGGLETNRVPRFIPLNVRKGKAELLINSVSGTPNAAHNDKDVGTPGGTNSFMVDLTALGAQEWSEGIRNRTHVPAGVKFTYEYLRMMPTVGAKVIVHGERVFEHLSIDANLTVGYPVFGGSVGVQAAWDKLVKNGSVEIILEGNGLDPELEKMRQELVDTFSKQAMERMFSSLFTPMPEVDPAKAGTTRGLYGGVNFGMKWKKQTDITNLNMDLKFQGWTWLTASMDADVTSFFANLDDSYVTEVNTEMSFPASIVVDSDPMLQDVAVSWSASEGKSPENPVYGAEGGTTRYTVTSDEPDNVEIRYRAQVNFTPPRWPVIEISGKGLVKDGGSQVVLKPTSWIGRHMIYMFVREGDEIKMVDTENDYLIANVSYKGPHLKAAIRESARISTLEPLEFAYPLDPQGRPGEAKFSAFGVIGGKLVRSKEQPIKFDEDAVFILADSNGLQLVSQAAVMGESDELAQRLLKGAGRPIVSNVNGVSTPNGPASEEGGTASRANRELSGLLVAVEFGADGPAILLKTERNAIEHIRLRDLASATALGGTKRNVRVRMDATGKFAERIMVEARTA